MLVGRGSADGDRQRRIAGLGDRALDLGESDRRGIVLDGGLLGREVDRDRIHSRELADHPLNRLRARGAGHAADGDGEVLGLAIVDRLVARLGDGRFDLVDRQRARLELDQELLGGKIDRRLLDAGQFDGPLGGLAQAAQVMPFIFS